jgi:intein/homing endonuclease
VAVSKKAGPGEGISALIRDAGQRAKLAVEQREVEEAEADAVEVFDANGDLVLDEIRPFKPRIFNVVDYIEQSWGLGMKLFPAQRFLVKLYYHLPLEENIKTIKVTDMFASKVLYEFTEKEYLRFLYEEGRCNIGEQDHERRELVLAIGRRAGKCLKEGSVVLTEGGFCEIQDLGDPEGPEYQPLQVGVAQEGGTRSTSAFFYNGGVRDTVRVRGRCGYEVEGTPNHRVRVMGADGDIQWRFLGDIQVGDRLGIHRKTDLWAKTPVDTTPYLVGINGYKDVTLTSVFDESWGTLLGVLVGDGTWNRGGLIEVTVGPYPEWLTQVGAIFRSTVGEPITRLEKRTRRAHRVQFGSTKTRQFLDRLGYKLGSKPDKKRIPWVIWRSPKPVVAAFLRGLFETDGSAERGGRTISFSTASHKLASEVQLLLLNFGIVSRIKPRLSKRFNKWYQHLTILGADSIRLFSEQIGFISERKAALLRSHVAKGDLGNKSATEAIPHQRQWSRRLVESVPKNNGNKHCEKLGWRRSLLRVALGNVIKNCNEELSYPRLRAAVQVAREVGADPEVIAHFDGLLEAGYFYDEVIEVTPSRGRVYDLTVPDGESFVANGFTNHNTTLSGVFASYEVYRLLNLGNPQEYYGLPNGNRIQIISVATDKDQASLLFNEVTSHLAKCEYFKPYVANNTLTHIQFRTPYDITKYGPTARQQNGKFVSFNGKATMRVTFKSCVAKGLRGAGNVVVILDEVAHFQDKGQSSAKDIYDAVTPSTAAFSPKDQGTPRMPMRKLDGSEYPVESRIISISSPLNKSGKFYDLYHLAMTRGPGSDNMLAIQAPTWEVNPTLPASYYRQKYHADPAVFITEHGAQFSDRTRGWIERESDLIDCVVPSLRPQLVGVPRYPHEMGIDIGLMGDGTAICITCEQEGKIVLAYHELWQAGVDWRESNPHLGNNFSTDYCKTLGDVARIDFDEIGELIHKLTKRFFITKGIFDRWNGLPLEQALLKKGLTQFTSEFFQRDFSSRIYQNTKMLMFDKGLALYDYPKPDGVKHSGFLEELLNLQAQQMSKNIVVVTAPKTAGCHDDQSDAYVRSVWLTAERMRNQSHVYGASAGLPGRGGPVMTPARYQMMRARSHGGFAERSIPKNLGLRGRLAQTRIRTR